MRKSTKAIIAALSASIMCAVPVAASFAGTAAVTGITAEAASDVIATGCYVKSLAEQNSKAVVAEGLVYELNDSNYTATLAGRWTNVSMVIMPDMISYKGHNYKITAIKTGSFKNTSGPYAIKEFKAGKYLETIGSRAFQNSPVRKINLNSGLLTIGSNAFEGAICTEIVIPHTVTAIESQAFKNTDLTSIFFDASASSPQLTLKSEAFSYNEKLKEITSYRKYKSIDKTAFKRKTLYIQEDYDFDKEFYVFGWYTDLLKQVVFSNIK